MSTFGFALLVIVLGVQGLEPPPAAETPTAQTPDAQPAADAEAIDRILTQLERRGEDVKDIKAAVAYRELDQLNLSERVKQGQILFLITDANPLFFIQFDKTSVDGQLGKREWYLFDGQWLYEANERTSQVTQRQITRPGEKADLFDIESAPFPLPFGQKKDKILAHFDVKLQPPAKGDPENTDHLVCVPKPDTRLARNYQKLEFYILKDLHLPRKVVMTKSQGYEVVTADFPDLSESSINTGVRSSDFQEPKAWQAYERVVERLEDPAPNP